MTTPDLTGLLRGLLSEPGRPRLTWYGPDGERVELSGHVLDNWVAKTTNLLVEELDVGPGSRVLLDLPAHWRTVVWAMAVWRAGACVVLDGPRSSTSAAAEATDDAGRPFDVAVTAAGSPPPAARDVVVVALPALARSAGADLPSGAIDAAAAVMTYADVLGPVRPAGADEPAVELRTGPGHPAVVRHADLLDWGATLAALPPVAAATAGPPAARRLLLEPSSGDPAPVLATALAVYREGGSLVLVAPQVVAELAADPARRERLRSGERVTG